MSIDARIIGVQVTPDNEVLLVLEPRDPRNAHHGTSRMTIVNPPDDPTRLEVLIGECVWGGDTFLLIGDTKFADRVGYTRLRLLEPKKRETEQ